MALGVFSFLDRNRTPTAQFWRWFQKNEDNLFRLESAQDRIFTVLVGKILKVDRNLVFEFGPVVEGRREFVLSAGGVKKAFPAVRTLADGAPQLSRWRVTKFRPRRAEITEIQFDGRSMSPDAVMVAVQPGAPYVDITVYLGDSGMDEETRGQFGFLFLDQVLGEFDVAIYAGRVEFKPLSHMAPAERIPLRSLAREFDILKARFN